MLPLQFVVVTKIQTHFILEKGNLSIIKNGLM